VAVLVASGNGAQDQLNCPFCRCADTAPRPNANSSLTAPAPVPEDPFQSFEDSTQELTERAGRWMAAAASNGADMLMAAREFISRIWPMIVPPHRSHIDGVQFVDTRLDVALPLFLQRERSSSTPVQAPRARWASVII